jgi:mRNA-degrading endonuclease RelE of RelBE toxin-antitoxin system
MSYSIFLSRKAEKQYKKLDLQISNRIKHKLNILKQYPHKGFALSGKYTGLRYLKVIYKRVEYRVVYDISDESKEVLIIFLGTRENFYKELRRYLG